MGKQYTYNYDYFETIDTPDKAYWLGFIAADGCVYLKGKGSYALSIALHIDDKDHLEKFRKDLSYTGVVSEYPSDLRPSCRISLYGEKICKDLLKQGITQRKSLTLKPWSGPAHLMKYYWRGVFDGDGGFSKSKKKRQSGKVYESWRAYVMGTKEMVSAFRDFIMSHKEFEYNTGTVKRHSSIWMVNYGGIRPAQTIASVLYDGIGPSLDRKQELSEAIMQTKMRKPIISHFEKDMLLDKKEKYGSWENVAKELGVSRNGLYKHLRKLEIPLRSMKSWTRMKGKQSDRTNKTLS